MVVPTLSTTISRRSMLAGGAGMLAAPVPALAAVPVPRLSGFGEQRSDQSLLEQIGAAHNCLAEYLRADAVCIRLYEAVSDHPGFAHRMLSSQAEWKRWEALMEQFGIVAADAPP